MEKFEKIKELVASLEPEVAKFEKGNSSAGTRARGILQEIAVLCKEGRADIQAAKNSKKSE